MLFNLHIQNYAIIDNLEVDFGKYLNIITGETGAGKSILMGALHLILGGRADTSALLEKDKKCVIEGLFRSKQPEILAFLREQELEDGEDIVIRREIAASGKSRAFINDTPVTVVQLQQLAAQLVDLHQQFDTLSLGEADFQRVVIDALAQQQPLLLRYQGVYRSWQGVQKQFLSLKQQQATAGKELDYYRFLFDELSEAGFRENEIEELEAELRLLNNTEGIKTALTSVGYALQDGEQPMVQQLKAMLNQVQHYAALHPELPGLAARLASVHIELQDVASDLERVNGQVIYDPERAAVIEDRLSVGYKLLKKHSVQNTGELLQLQVDIEGRLQQVLSLDEQLASLELETARLRQEAAALASELSAHRRKVVPGFESKVNSLLAQVGMPNARLKVDVQAGELQLYGLDVIEFLFDANKSDRFEPIRKVASGGELSRLMLSIKSLVASSMQLPTLIFDEIDTGISGEAAKQVGGIMKELGHAHQVICITHQPQIAAKADAHYFVYKKDDKGRIQTRVRLLADGERVEAIAKMLSGDSLSESALSIAREMVAG